jgi:alpha-L-arabinofuranosidase
MSVYLIPTDEDTIEIVARSIARNRLNLDATSSLQEMLGTKIDLSEKMENTFDSIFERLWAGNSEHDQNQKNGYRADALAAIRALNLKLIIAE